MPAIAGAYLPGARGLLGFVALLTLVVGGSFAASWFTTGSAQRESDDGGVPEDGTTAQVSFRRGPDAGGRPFLPVASRSGQAVGVHAQAFSPNTLPPPPAHFVGRERAVQLISASVARLQADGGLPIVALHGQGGVGKTALAVHYAERVHADYPDAQLYVDLRGPLGDPSAALAMFLRTLGFGPGGQMPSTLEERSAAYRALLNGRRAVVILDGVKDEQQVQPLLPNDSSCLVVITRRSPFTAFGATSVPVGTIHEDESLELLRGIAGDRLIDADLPAARRIVALCGGLPLALKLMGRHISDRSHRPLSDHADRLHAHRLETLSNEQESVVASLSVSYEALGDDCRRAFCLIGLLKQTTFRAWALAALLDSTLERADALLDELVHNQLAEVATTVPACRFVLHDLVRDFAVQHLEQELTQQERDEAAERLVQAYLVMAQQARGAIDRIPPDHLPPAPAGRAWRTAEPAWDTVAAEGVRWFTWEYPGLSAVVVERHAAADWETCWQIAGAAARCAGFFASTGSWQETIDLGLDAAINAGSPLGQALLLVGRAELRRAAGHFDAARRDLSDATRFFDEANDPYGRAAALRSLADLLRISGLLPQARLAAQQALEHSQEVGDRVGEARAQRLQGFILTSEHRGVAARSCLVRAHERFRADGDKVLAARTEAGLAGAARVERDFDTAIRWGTQALDQFREVGVPVDYAASLHELAHVYLDAGRLTEADDCLTESLGAFEELGFRLHIARVRRNIGWLRIAQGRPGEAVGEARAALRTFEETSSEYWMAQGSWVLGAGLLADGAAPRALELLEGAAEVFERLRTDWDHAACLLDVARAHCRLREPEKGWLQLCEAVAGFSALGLTVDVTFALTVYAREAQRTRTRAGRRLARYARAEAAAMRSRTPRTVLRSPQVGASS